MDAGSVVDKRYEVIRPLSMKGGMGDVYLCLDRKLNRQVALKLIKPEHAAEAEYRERFQREVDAAISLEGHDVVRIHDSGECVERRTPYYVMEYLRGRDLSQELSARGQLELSRAVAILLDVCKVVGAAHNRNIVHRDLKPSNLFLEGPPSPRRSVRVLDFGVARVLGDPRDGAITKLGGQPGSPNYMSPEQHKNDPEVGVAADIWALGAIFYEMLVGEKACPGESSEARRRVLEGATPSIQSSHPELPSALDRIVQKCLEKDPRTRYASVRELEDDLRNLQTEHAQPCVTHPTLVGRPLQRARRRSFRSPWAFVLAGLGVSVIALFALLSWQRHEVSRALAAAPDPRTKGAEVATVPPSPMAPKSEAADRSTTVALAPARDSGKADLVPEVPPTGSDGAPRRAGKSRRALASGTAPAPRVPLPSVAPKLSRNETRLKTK